MVHVAVNKYDFEKINILEYAFGEGGGGHQKAYAVYAFINVDNCERPLNSSSNQMSTETILKTITMITMEFKCPNLNSSQRQPLWGRDFFLRLSLFFVTANLFGHWIVTIGQWSECILWISRIIAQSDWRNICPTLAQASFTLRWHFLCYRCIYAIISDCPVWNWRRLFKVKSVSTNQIYKSYKNSDHYCSMTNSFFVNVSALIWILLPHFCSRYRIRPDEIYFE